MSPLAPSSPGAASLDGPPSAPASPEVGVLPLWVFGSTGMLAGELLRLAADHPRLALAGAVSRDAGRSLAAVHPHLPDHTTIDFAGATAALVQHLADPAARAVVVLGLPHGSSAAAWRDLRSALGDGAERVHLIDLGGDHRVGNGEFVYGLPELNGSDLPGATRIAAPGCFATALQLAAAPAAAHGIADAGRGPWTFSAVTGSSGSGNEPKATTHHPHRDGNLWAYAVGGHRHEPELAQELAKHGAAPPVVFLPHSGPFVRGIHLTAVLPLAAPTTTEAVHAAYAAHYDGQPFVEVLGDGVPDLRRVVGSNRACLAVQVRDDALVVLVTLDNLVKGGAGQALQALNVSLGLPQDTGLPRNGLGVL